MERGGDLPALAGPQFPHLSKWRKVSGEGQLRQCHSQQKPQQGPSNANKVNPVKGQPAGAGRSRLRVGFRWALRGAPAASCLEPDKGHRGFWE